ncbi:MAG: LexA family protein [Halanaerobiales bacterium]
MTTLGEKLKELRNEQGLSLRDLAAKAGDISVSYLSDIENNRHDPSLKKLKTIAKALDISTAYLLDIYDMQNGGGDKFKLKNYEKVDDNTEIVNIPIIGKISGGIPILAEQNIEGFEQIPKGKVRGGDYFLLRVEGDSMINAGIFEDDLVLIKRQPECESGEIAAVLIEDEGTLKRVYFNSHNRIFPTPDICVGRYANPPFTH